MSNFGGGQGTPGQNQQNYSFTDGNGGTTNVSYSSQQYTWSNSQPGVQQQPPFIGPQMPAMLDFNQLHQQHMNLHQAGMQAAMHMHQNMMQPFQNQQPALMPAMQQSQGQIQYAQAPPAELPPPKQQLQIQAADDDSSSEDDYDARAGGKAREARAAERDREARAAEKVREDRAMERDREARAAEKARDDRAAERDRQMLGVAQKIEDQMRRGDQRLRDQAEAQTLKEAARQAQQDQAAKEHRKAMQQLQDQIAALQSQVSKPQPTTPAIDMGALQKMISEGRTEQISKADIKQLIDDAVSKQLSGVAKSSDLELAASRMERNLHKVAGASDKQVAQQVQKELTSAINQVGRRMDAQQQRIAAPQPSAQQQTRVPPQFVPPRMETEFTIEELPNEESKSRHKSRHSKMKALPAPESSSSSSSKPSVMPMQAPANNAIVPLKAENLPAADTESSTKSKDSTVSVLPSDSNAMVRSKSRAARTQDSRPTSGSKDPSRAIHAPPDSVALNASNLSQPEPTRSKSSKMSTASVQPSDMNAMVRSKAKLDSSRVSATPKQLMPPDSGIIAPTQTNQVPATSSKSSKMSTASVAPSDMNAMVRAKTMHERSKTSTTPKELPPAEAGMIAPTQTGQMAATSSQSSKMSTMSAQPSKNNALVRAKGKDASRQDGKESRSSKTSTGSVHPSESNAMVKSSSRGTPSQSDRRAEASGSKALKQLENGPQEGDIDMSMAMVKQSRDLAKKSAE